MLNAYEQRLVAFYLANAASALHHRDREASDLADWVADRGFSLSLQGPPGTGKSAFARYRSMMARPSNDGTLISSSAGLQMCSSISYPYSASSSTKARYAGSTSFSEAPPIPNADTSLSSIE